MRPNFVFYDNEMWVQVLIFLDMLINTQVSLSSPAQI